MRKVLIKLDLNTIKEFNLIATREVFDMDLMSIDGRYVIDAKSIMGIYSLNLSRNLVLIIHEDGPSADEFVAKISKYIVSENVK